MTIFIAILVGGFFLYVILRMFGSAGRPGINESNRFPYDSGASIPPPSWTSDSSSEAACDAGADGGSADGGGCDSGGSAGE